MRRPLRIEERRFGPSGTWQGKTSFLLSSPGGRRLRRARLLPVLGMVIAMTTGIAQAGIKVEITGVEGDLRANVVTFLSVERNRELKDIDTEMMTGLFNRIDRKSAERCGPSATTNPS